MAVEEPKYLFIKSDNLIKVQNLVKKSFGDDVQINDATVIMNLFKATKISISANQVAFGDEVEILAGDVINRGSGEVGIIIKGNPLSANDNVSIFGTDNYDGNKSVKSVEFALAVQEVQTLSLDTVATAGTFTLTYKGETTAAIAYNETLTNIKSALEALSTVNTDDIVVGGSTLDVGDMTFTFAAVLQDVPMLEVDISGLTGPSTGTVTQTVQGHPAGYQSEIVFDAEYIEETFDGSEVMQQIFRGAINRGSGLVGIPVQGHTLKANDVIRIWGTENYNGVYTIDNVVADEIRIPATFVEEQFTGSEYFYRGIKNGTNLTCTAEGSGGNYSGVVPDTVELVKDDKYLLEVNASKSDDDLLAQFECIATFFPKQDYY